MSGIKLFSINYEGLSVSVIETHIRFLYIEDEYIDELIKNVGCSGYNIKHSEKLNGLFKNIDNFWSDLNDRIHIYDYDFNFQYENMEKLYGFFVSKKLLKEFDRLKTENNTEYEDNYRVALKGNVEQEKQYYKSKKEGCCGFIDETVCIDGINYLIGLNYGH